MWGYDVAKEATLSKKLASKIRIRRVRFVSYPWTAGKRIRPMLVLSKMLVL